jgi:hypothetical protein
MHCGSWHVAGTRDVFGALFVRTLYFFHLLFRCSRFSFFSTVFFNNFEVRILEPKRPSTGGRPACTWSFVTTRYVMRDIKWAGVRDVKLQTMDEDSSSVSGSMTKEIVADVQNTFQY